MGKKTIIFILLFLSIFTIITNGDSQEKNNFIEFRTFTEFFEKIHIGMKSEEEIFYIT